MNTVQEELPVYIKVHTFSGLDLAIIGSLVGHLGRAGGHKHPTPKGDFVPDLAVAVPAFVVLPDCAAAPSALPVTALFGADGSAVAAFLDKNGPCASV